MNEPKVETTYEGGTATGDDIRAQIQASIEATAAAEQAAKEAAEEEAEKSSDDDENQDDDISVDDSLTTNTGVTKGEVPLMPPKNTTTAGFVIPQDTKDRHIWFRILEPREHKGFDGPYCESDLRFMYKKGDIDDDTMLWSEGRRDWEQLLYMNDLRPRLLVVPMLPPRISQAKGKDAKYEAFNPIITAPEPGDASGAKPLDPFLNVNTMNMHTCCSRCGSIAVGHMPGVGEAKVDMLGLRQSLSFQNKDMASEVVPGIVWCGNSSAAKLNPLVDHGITLVINCTNNLGNPKEQLPYFRCKTIPLKDKPSSSTLNEELPKMLDYFEKVCDYIENERINPERALQSDPIPEPDKLAAKTDKYGRPIKSQADRAIQLRLGKVKRVPRVLLWSRKGMDRPCVLAIAYMIKQYGISVDKGLSIVDIARPGALVCKFYKKCLIEWSKRYTKGDLLCIDCLNVSKDVTTHSTHNELLLSAEQLLAEAGSVSVPDKEKDTQSLATYLDMIPQGNEATKITKLGDVSVYLPKIYRGSTMQSGWTGLLDLELTGRRLGDETTLDLFTAFSHAGVCIMLRTISLRSNGLTSKGVEYIMKALTGDLVKSLVANTAVSMKDLLASRMHGLGGSTLSLTDAAKNSNQSETADEKKDGSVAGVVSTGEGEEEDRYRGEGPFPHLMSLDLADNDITIDGSLHITEILKQTMSLVRLDISNNPLGDDGCRELIRSLHKPNPDFVEEGASKKDERFNTSLTYLDMSSTGLGHYASEQLLDFFRCNHTMHTLILDSNPECQAKSMKHIFNAIRGYSKSFSRLHLNDNNITLKSMGYLCRLLEEPDLPLRHLEIGQCLLSSNHTSYLSNSIMRSLHLSHLNMNSNALGEDGSDALAEKLYVDHQIFVPVPEEDKYAGMTEEEKIRVDFVDHYKVETYADLERDHAAEAEAAAKLESYATFFRGVKVPGPPLHTVDFSYCSLKPTQGKALLKAFCSRPQIRIIRMNGNDIGEHLEDITPYMALSEAREIQLNQCNLMAKGAQALFNILLNTEKVEAPAPHGNCLGNTLRALYIANNDIHDSIIESLCPLLLENMVLEHLDLGFNQLTDAITPKLKETVAVTSSSTLAQKVSSLSVNVLGNRCDPHALDLPGMARSKITFRFGVNASAVDDINDGFSHVSQAARKHFFMRKDYLNAKLNHESTTSLDQGEWRQSNLA